MNMNAEHVYEKAPHALWMVPFPVMKSFFQLWCVHAQHVRMWKQNGHQKEVAASTTFIWPLYGFIYRTSFKMTGN